MRSVRRRRDAAAPVQPLDHMTSRLSAAKRAGEPFEAAWADAIETLPEPVVTGSFLPRCEHQAWAAAFRGTREGWRRAFEDEPARELERLVARMAA